LPVSHALQFTDALTAYSPAAHVLHTAVANVFCSWYLPFKQLTHAVALVANFVPAAQNLQLYSMDPANSWNLPSSQFLHTAVALAEYNPAVHVLQPIASLESNSWNWPVGHVSQPPDPTNSPELHV